MNNSYTINFGQDFYPDKNDNIMDSLFKQYERVIVESLISSFGLDFLVKDQYGGDVDTINNVRKIEKDSQMYYKNKFNQSDYDNKGNYNSHDYHSDKVYKNINKQIKIQKQEGNLIDSYTGKKFNYNDKTDLDHVIAAKEIHEDRGRVLANLNGINLANCPENLKVTNPHTNRSKKADSMNEFLNKNGHEYTDSQKKRMYKIDLESRKSYEKKLAIEYYTSSKFAKDVTFAASNVGFRMGIKQALGFVFAEIWFSVKEKFKYVNKSFDFSEFLKSMAEGIKEGFENAKSKYREIFEKFKEGAIAGTISSITTTLCNIFFTTSKNIAKIIRHSYISLVQAAKILFINPDNLPFGERIRAVVKIISTGASIVLGTIVSEAIGKTHIGQVPIVGDIIQTFCATFVTGIMSCSLLYFFDRSEIMNKLVSSLNNLNTLSTEVNYFYNQALYFEMYAAELMNIDIDKFRQETEIYNSLATQIENAKNEIELNSILKNALNKIDSKIPWKGNFNTFMSNKNSVLVFE